MQNIIDLKGRVCDRCRTNLINERLIRSAFNSNACYCEKCANNAADPLPSIYHTYINTNGGCAVLALDNAAYGEMVKTMSKAIRSEKMTVLNTPLDAVNFTGESVLIIELPDKIERPSPQQRLLDENPDINSMAQAALDSRWKVVLRYSPLSKLRCIFYKTDSREDTYECLSKIEKQLSEMNDKLTVYMERSSNDPYDAARLMLASSGFRCVYCTGEKIADNPRGIFALDFTQKELFDYCRKRIIGQDKELNTAVFLVYNYLLNTAEGKKTPVKNWILTAPSGMGKTEFFRCLHDFFAEHNVPVPVIQLDLSQITETGFKGKNMDVILSTIHDAEPRHRKLPKGAAICFLDEADKKFKPSYDGKKVNINAATQSNLLTLIEGSVLSPADEDYSIDTSDTMFVFMGAFQSLRDKKKDDAEVLQEIFVGDEFENAEDSFYGDLNFDDMISFGLIEELAGRITMIVNFRKLPENDMRRLIAEKARITGEEFGVSIRLMKKGVDELLSDAYGNLGVRTPVNKLRELVITALAKRSLESEPFDSACEEIVIRSKTCAEISRRA